jgi:hypothetical protein
VLKLAVKCTLPVSQSCNAATDFIGSQSIPPITFTKNFLASSFSNFWSLGGFYLTDPSTGTEYIPVYQASGEPLTAPLSNNMVPGETYPVWIYLSAPPASTTAVTVSLPGGTPKIADVPITPAPPLASG